MTRTQYQALRESIRTNGLRYTLRIAQESGNIDALAVIDGLVNQCIKPTDWLTMRHRWVKTEPDAIRLTTWLPAYSQTI